MQMGSAGQPLPVWTPLHAIEDGVGVVEVPQDLDTVPGSWVPQPDGTIPPATGEPAAIGTPPHAVHDPAMATDPPACRATGPIHDGHQGVRATTGPQAAA